MSSQGFPVASKKKADGPFAEGGSVPAATKPVSGGHAGPTVRVPTAEDLDLARNDALLQLRIGQSAHYYSILVAIALLVDILFVLYFPPNLASRLPGHLRDVYFLAFPLFGALFLAVVGLRVKWETYQLWPWEPHFWASIAAVAYNALLTYLYVASVAAAGPTASWPILPWFYPAVLGGLSLALVGLALTWSEWTHRKTISVVAALLPIPFAFALVFASASSQVALNALALSLAASAVLYLISGGFLHIISSGTRTHEREIITSGQSRVFQVVEEVRRREDALRFREATLLKREADAEDAEDGLRRQRESVELARSQIDQLDNDIRQRSDALRAAEQAHVGRAAEVNTTAQTVRDKQADLEIREKEVQTRLPRIAEREQLMLQRETEHRQREADLVRREQELTRRQTGIPEAEADLVRRRQELDSRTSDMLRRESELKTREAGGVVRPGTSGAPPLEEREARLNQLKITLDEQNLVLGRKAHQLDESLREILRREQEIAHREEGVTGREAALTQRETDAKEQYELGDSRRQQYEEALRQYEEKLRSADLRDAELGSRKGELERTGSTLGQRESQLKERELQLNVQRTALDRLQRVITERQKSLEAREDEVALRAQSLGRGAPARPSSLGPTKVVPVEGAPVPDLLAAPTGRRIADRAPTGTPRLDDLLQGGVPPHGQILVIGDAFVGKEIVLHDFLAEGLKNGEPAVIITTSRSPDEVGQQIGLVSPQFHEYEQMGQVSWIDASRPQAGPAGGVPSAGHPNSVAVNGPDDHAGILKALVGTSKRFEGATRFRVAYFGLAASLAHADERASMVFLQNLVGILRPRPALAMYSLEAGALTDALAEQILSRMDGAIRFKQERDKTFLSVAGFGEVATREWIECRATNRTLVIGSFSLERIR
jgi:KaiC/GvpD/RAD55 family RecA-like ATPase